MKNFVQPGNTVTATAPTGGIASGEGAVFTSVFGVANTTAAEGEPVEVDVVGVFELPKAAGAIAAFARTYWDDTNDNVTTTASGNRLIGFATEAAGASDTIVRVRLNGVAA